MTKRLIRIWNELDVEEVKKHLLIYGDLSGVCANCSEMGIGLDVNTCPKCSGEFLYIAFRHPEANMSKIIKLREQRKNITFIDYNDFVKITGSIKAHDFFK